MCHKSWYCDLILKQNFQVFCPNVTGLGTTTSTDTKDLDPFADLEDKDELEQYVVACEARLSAANFVIVL